MKATVAKKAKSKKEEAKQRGETLFSHLFYTLSDNGQFVKHSKRLKITLKVSFSPNCASTNSNWAIFGAKIQIFNKAEIQI